MSALTTLKKILRQNSWFKRIMLAARANDCKDVPKVELAGRVISWNGAPVQIMHNGVKVFEGGYHGAPMTRIIKILKGHHEPQEEKIFHEVLKHIPDDAVMLEIGSFWAYYSLWFSHEKPARRNFLIEPVEWKRLIGQLNFTLNEKSIAVDPYYIDNPEQSIEASTGSAAELLKSAKPITLDSYLEMKTLDHVHVLHADIQGAEVALLNGASEALKAHKIDYIFLSTHDNKHEPCITALEKQGYEILVQHAPEQSLSADGLIVAAGRNAPMKEKLQVEHA